MCWHELFHSQDPKWLHLVEFIFGQNLNSFAVDNTDDKKLLDAIIDGVYKQFGSKGSRPSICLLKFGEKVKNCYQKFIPVASQFV